MPAGSGHDTCLDDRICSSEPGYNLTIGQCEQARLVREAARQHGGCHDLVTQRRRDALELFDSHPVSQPGQQELLPTHAPLWLIPRHEQAISEISKVGTTRSSDSQGNRHAR